MAKANNKKLEKLKESNKRLKERYRKQNERNNKIYDRISFTVPAGKKAEIEEASKAFGMSVNAFCRETVLKAIYEASGDDLPAFMRE